jgi:DNA repair exonuclease SbcCD ATPase subunit
MLSERIEKINGVVEKKLEAVDESNNKLKEEVDTLKKQLEELNKELSVLKKAVGIQTQPRPRSFTPEPVGPQSNTNAPNAYSLPPIQFYNTNKTNGFSKKEQGLVRTLLDYSRYEELNDSQRKTLRDIVEAYK